MFPTATIVLRVGADASRVFACSSADIARDLIAQNVLHKQHCGRVCIGRRIQGHNICRLAWATYFQETRHDYQHALTGVIIIYIAIDDN